MPTDKLPPLQLPPLPENIFGVGSIVYEFTPEQLRADHLAVARAVVEQCAQICRKLTEAGTVYTPAYTPADCEDAIRSLLEDTHGV